MYEKFANSRIYVGASRSDGISTSFLEALVLGAYPIQTNTSCANEWVDKGFHAHLIEPNRDAIFQALISTDNLSNLEEIRLINKALASKILKFETIKLESIKFYGVL
jgi:glycosyltransferase involved in cell wall biosynthesis